jgi:pilus assembly protein CpaF
VSAGPPLRAAAATPDADLVDELHRALVERMRHGTTTAAQRRSAVTELVRAREPLAGASRIASLRDRVLARVDGLGVLEPLLADDAVTEVMVNGPGPVWVERDGRLEATAVVVDEATVLQLIERIVAPLGRRVDRASPSVDARLPDGSRVHAIVPPLAVDGPCLTIRRFRVRSVGVEDFAPDPVARLLRWAVTARCNVLVSGGTGSGKTTLLNALAASLRPGERVITVEDAAELNLRTGHVVRLEARPPNSEGAGTVTVRELVRDALRMRPDRILVGEVRGPEALDMVQAMNTGHEGSLSTCHANGPVDALRRIETMMLLAGSGLGHGAVREQLAGAVDLVVQVARRPGGRRRVVEVAEVCGLVDGTWSLGRVADEHGLAMPLQRTAGRDPEVQPWAGP